MGQSATIPRRTTWAAVVMDGTAGAGRMSSAASDSGKADRRTQRWSLDDQPEGLPNRFGGVVVASVLFAACSEEKDERTTTSMLNVRYSVSWFASQWSRLVMPVSHADLLVRGGG